MDYFPDSIKAAYVNRDLLFNVIFHADNMFYKSLEKVKNEEQVIRGRGTFNDVGIQITSKWGKMLKDYPSLNRKLIFN